MRLHPYKANPQSGAGNCRCGHAENTRAHPHAFTQAGKSELCVCAWPAASAVHTDAATARPEPVSTGIEKVQAAVRAARGGDAPVQVRGFA